MQKLMIAGNVGKDAVLRRTGNGDAVLGFSLAVDNGKNKDGTRRDSTWFDCSVWGKRAESLERYIVKGQKLVLIGRPTAREHDGKVFLGISVDDLTFLGGASGQSVSGGHGSDDDRHGSQERGGGSAGGGFSDDIPFSAIWWA